MKKVELNQLEIVYIPGTYVYNQRIKGKYNYEHSYGNKNYNGCGGEQVFTSSKLNLYGVKDDNKEMQVSIKNDILKTFNREKLSDDFVGKLEANMPNIITVEQDESDLYHLSKESCREIFRTIYPRKKFFV